MESYTIIPVSTFFHWTWCLRDSSILLHVIVNCSFLLLSRIQWYRTYHHLFLHSIVEWVLEKSLVFCYSEYVSQKPLAHFLWGSISTGWVFPEALIHCHSSKYLYIWVNFYLLLMCLLFTPFYLFLLVFDSLRLFFSSL